MLVLYLGWGCHICSILFCFGNFGTNRNSYIPLRLRILPAQCSLSSPSILIVRKRMFALCKQWCK